MSSYHWVLQTLEPAIINVFAKFHCKKFLGKIDGKTSWNDNACIWLWSMNSNLVIGKKPLVRSQNKQNYYSLPTLYESFGKTASLICEKINKTSPY